MDQDHERLCGDFWNLLPALRCVNQRQKTDRLPSAERLAKAREIIIDWWTAGYVKNENPLIGKRFSHRGVRILTIRIIRGLGVKLRPLTVWSHGRRPKHGMGNVPRPTIVHQGHTKETA